MKIILATSSPYRQETFKRLGLDFIAESSNVDEYGAERPGKPEELVKYLSKLKQENIPVFLNEGNTAIGGGSLPGQTLPTQLIYIKPPCSVEFFSKELRLFSPPLLGRKEKIILF